MVVRSELQRNDPALFEYLVEAVRAKMTSEIAAHDIDQAPKAARSYEMMANFLANKAAEMQVSLSTENDVDNLVGNPMFQIGMAYGAAERRRIELGQ